MRLLSTMYQKVKPMVTMRQLLKVLRGRSKARKVGLDFLPAYQEVLQTPPSVFGRAFAIFVITLCTGVITWAALGKIDVIASSTGKIIVGNYSKVVQAPTDGEVTKILVQNGERVKEGEVIIELNPTSAEAETRRIQEQLLYSQLEVSRLKALLSKNLRANISATAQVPRDLLESEREYLEIERREQQARRETIEAEIASNQAEQRSLKTAIEETGKVLENMRDRYDARKGLSEQGLYSRMQLMEQDQQLLQMQSERSQQVSQLEVLKAREVALLKQFEEQTAVWRSETRTRLAQAVKNDADLKERLVQAREAVRMHKIVAPVDGVVQQAVTHTIGGVVQQGQDLMVIVPANDSLEAEINVLSKDVGFVRPGQEVEIKVDSFPYTKYGTIKGKVRYVSRDSANDEKLGLVYPARVSLETQAIDIAGTKQLLNPGMGVVAEIKTDDRKVIEYLLSPLKEYQSEALRER